MGDRRDEITLAEALLESAPNGMLVIDRDQRIATANAAVEALFGYTREELIGEPMTLLMPERHAPMYAAQVARFLERPGVSPMPGQRLEGLRKDTTEIPVEVSLASIETPSSLLVCAVIRDMREQVGREEQLRIKDAQLLQAQKMEAIGALAGGVAHEMNNLVHAIRQYTDLAVEMLTSEDEALHPLTKIAVAADRAAGLTRQLLSFSRRQPIKRVPTDVNASLHEVTQLLRPLLPRNIHVSLELESEHAWGMADGGLLHQAVVNLCHNARDAMADGGNITIASCERGDQVVIEVRDDGSGMTEEVRARAFEPFFTTKPPGKGTGLGLAVVYGIAQSHGGTIEVESEPGRGTTFRLCVPVLVDHPADVTWRELTAPGDLTGYETILLAEDEPLVAEATVHVLEKAGYQVLHARDGREALEIFDHAPGAIDLVILDMVMPILSGREAYDRLKAIRPDLPIVFCTGYDPDAGRAGFRDIPDLHLVTKPFTKSQLLGTIRALLGA